GCARRVAEEPGGRGGWDRKKLVARPVGGWGRARTLSPAPPPFSLCIVPPLSRLSSSSGSAKVRLTQAAPTPPAEAMAPRNSWSCGRFFIGPRRKERDVGAGDEALHRPGCGRARGAVVGAGDPRGDGRPEGLRPARHRAARLA